MRWGIYVVHGSLPILIQIKFSFGISIDHNFVILKAFSEIFRYSKFSVLIKLQINAVIRRF